MTSNIQRYNTEKNTAAIEKIIANGDLSGLSPEERTRFYEQTCRSLGVNPFTRPLVYIKLNGALTLYATARCTQQIAMARGISFKVSEPKIENNLITVLVEARDPQGRTDSDIGALEMPANAKPYEIANIIKKCITQAKRRVILSMFGLGWASGEEQRDHGDPEPNQVEVELEDIETPAEPAANHVLMYSQIKAAAASKGIPDETLRESLAILFGVRTSKDLTPGNLATILEWINKYE